MIEQVLVVMLFVRGFDQMGEIINKLMLQFMNKISEVEVIGKFLLEFLLELKE